MPLYAFARRHLGALDGLPGRDAYFFYPPLHGSNLYDFHYLPFAPFFLWMTLALLEARRDRWAAVAMVLTLSNREDMSALLGGRRPVSDAHRAAPARRDDRRGGGRGVLRRREADPDAPLPRRATGVRAPVPGPVPAGDEGLRRRAQDGVRQPGFTITSLLERDKLVYLLQIMAPLAFFPCAGRSACCARARFLLHAAGNPLPGAERLRFQYTAYWTSFCSSRWSQICAGSTARNRRRPDRRRRPTSPAAAGPGRSRWWERRW